MDPVFRSHIPEIMEDEEMEMSGLEMSNYSLDSILEGIDDKQNAIEYIQNLCATISHEVCILFDAFLTCLFTKELH